MALLQDQQRGEKLAAKLLRPITAQRQRGERANDVEPAAVCAERCFDPPQRQNDPPIDAILALDRVERRLPFARLAYRALDARLRCNATEIVGDGSAVFRLARRERGGARI